jgi:hypothetical protein
MIELQTFSRMQGTQCDVFRSLWPIGSSSYLNVGARGGCQSLFQIIEISSSFGMQERNGLLSNIDGPKVSESIINLLREASPKNDWYRSVPIALIEVRDSTVVFQRNSVKQRFRKSCNLDRVSMVGV